MPIEYAVGIYEAGIGRKTLRSYATVDAARSEAWKLAGLGFTAWFATSTEGYVTIPAKKPNPTLSATCRARVEAAEDAHTYFALRLREGGYFSQAEYDADSASIARIDARITKEILAYAESQHVHAVVSHSGCVMLKLYGRNARNLICAQTRYVSSMDAARRAVEAWHETLKGTT